MCMYVQLQSGRLFSKAHAKVSTQHNERYSADVSIKYTDDECVRRRDLLIGLCAALFDVKYVCEIHFAFVRQMQL